MSENPAPQKRPKPKPNTNALATAIGILRESLAAENQSEKPFENAKNASDNLGQKRPFSHSGCQIWLPENITVPPAGILSGWIFSLRPAWQRLDLGWLFGRLFWPGAANARAPREDSPVLQSGWHIDGERRILRRLGPGKNAGQMIDFNQENPNTPPKLLRLVADGLSPQNMRWNLILANGENGRDVHLINFQGTDLESLPQIEELAKLLAQQLKIQYLSTF